MQVGANIRTPPSRPVDPEVLISMGKYVPMKKLAAILEQLFKDSQEAVRTSGRSHKAALAYQGCVLAMLTFGVDLPPSRVHCLIWCHMPQEGDTLCDYPGCQYPAR